MNKRASITRRVKRWYSKVMSRILVWAVFFQIRSQLSLVNDPRISNFSLGQLAEVLAVPETTSPSELIKAFHRGARFWRVEPNDLFQAFYTRANRPSAVGYGQTQNSIWDYRTRTEFERIKHDATSEHPAEADIEQSWAEATNQFLDDPESFDWPGGSRNLETLALQLDALGLTNAVDKKQALISAYRSMKAHGLVIESD